MASWFYKGLAHISIFTDDVQKSEDFYIQNLGFRIYNKKSFPDFELWFIENGGLILELNGQGAKDVNGKIDHIALEVLGLDAAIEDLREKGVVFETKEPEIVKPNFANGIRNIFIVGPSGERIELFEYLV